MVQFCYNCDKAVKTTDKVIEEEFEGLDWPLNVLAGVCDECGEITTYPFCTIIQVASAREEQEKNKHR